MAPTINLVIYSILNLKYSRDNIHSGVRPKRIFLLSFINPEGSHQLEQIFFFMQIPWDTYDRILSYNIMGWFLCFSIPHATWTCYLCLSLSITRRNKISTYNYHHHLAHFLFFSDNTGSSYPDTH